VSYTDDFLISRLPTHLFRGRLIVYILFAALSAILVLLYTTYLSRINAGLYQLTQEQMFFRAIFGASQLTLVTFTLPNNDRRPSTVMFTLLYLFLYLPSMLYYILAGGDVGFTIAITVTMLAAIVLLRSVPPIFIETGCARFSNTSIPVIGAIVTGGVVLAGMAIANGTPRFDPLLYSNTYTIRSAFQTPRIPGFGYLVNWVPKVFLPFLAAYFWYKKWYRIVAVVGTVAIIMYLYSPQKLFLAPVPFAAGIVFLSTRKRVLPGLMAISLCVVVGGYIAGIAMDIPALSYQVSARLFFIQGRGQYLYQQFFSAGNPHLWLATTPFNPASPPYTEPVSYLVSGALLDSPHNMNSGVFGDAYAHAGLLGVLALAPLLAGIGRILDGGAYLSDYRLIVAASATPLFTLTQVGITVAIATNGIIAALGIAVLYRPMHYRDQDV